MSEKEGDNEIGEHENVEEAGEAVSDGPEAPEQEGCGSVGIIGCIVRMASFLRDKASA